MKPLKDIGRIMFAVISEDGERAYAAFTPGAANMFAMTYGLDPDTCEVPDKDRDFIDGQFYSLQERRELVLRVWEMARAGIKDTTGAEYDLDGFRYAEGI